MDINYEIVQYYIYKKIIKKKLRDKVLEDCKRLNMTVEKYMQVKNYSTEVQALPALGEFYNLAYAEIDMFDFEDDLADQYNLNFLKKIKAVPIFKTDAGVLLVAVGKPLDFNAVSMISTIYTGQVEYVLVPPTQIDVLMDSILAVRSTTSALETLQTESDKQLLRDANATDNSNSIANIDDIINAPSVRLVDSIIKEAIPFRASDIHIEPYEKIVKVRYRIDGDLQERADFPIESYPAICARLKILSGLNIAERRVPQDGRINLNINGTEYDFRVSSLPTVHGEKFVIRILDKTSFRFTRQELGFTPAENEVIDKILAHPHGIVLLTGPTGCGKSTTLYSFLKEKNTPQVNIITVEDPVEYTLNGVNQVQVNTKANMTFASALRSILRQDPDVIMIGEIRDEETAEIAIRAAITGHLVFSTLHTNDAPGAVNRLVDMGVSSYLVKDSLVAVISQRLVKRLCPVCKKRSKTTDEEMQLLDIPEPATIFRSVRCQFCTQTG
ncbi:MAG: type II/IV secretion system protein [Clostridia bacterium]|nr:type II/IV secretion system protein [Clostridia bacterium]